MKRSFFVTAFFLLSTASLYAQETLATRLQELSSSTLPGVSELGSVLTRSIAAYAGVNDYKAVFLKQEESKGSLGEKETIFLKFEKPFKIFLHWFDTHRKGLQVLYERGRHDGKLAIHQPGLLLGLMPIIFLDQSSPWVREGSESYDIEDAGIGTFLYDLSEMSLKGAEEKKISVKLSKTDSGTDVDLSFPGTAEDGDYFASRVETFFDAKTQLPVRMRLYDWAGKVTGIYEYRDLSLNVGAEDPEFKKIAERALYKLFVPRSKVIKNNNFSARKSS